MQSDLEELLDPNFDIQKHIGNILKNGDYADQIEKLSITINSLDKRLHNQISSHYDELLSQTFNIKEMDAKFIKIQQRVICLKNMSNRLKAKIFEPYNAIDTQTKQLSNLQVTCDLLRLYSRFNILVSKLKVNMVGDLKDIAKAAFNIRDIESLLAKDPKLADIEDVKVETDIVRSSKCELEVKAYKLLHSGISTKNQVQTGAAILVFYYFGKLISIVDALVQDYCDTFRNDLIKCLDMEDGNTVLATVENKEFTHPAPKHEGSPQRPSTLAYKGSITHDNSSTLKKGDPLTKKVFNDKSIKGKSQGELKGIFWSEWDKFLCDTAYNVITSVAHLQMVLVKKKDSLQTTTTDDTKLITLMEAFLNRSETILAEEVALRHGSQKKQYVLLKQIGEGEYPRLLRSLQDLKTRLFNSNSISQLCNNESCQVESEYEMVDMGDILDAYVPACKTDKKLLHIKNGSGVHSKLQSWCREPLVNNFQKGYLSKSLSRLFDPVNVLFSSSSSTGSPPTLEDIGSLFKVMTNELAVAKFDPDLMYHVGRNVLKTVKLLLVKCEQMLDNSPLAYKITTQPNNPQINNATVASILYYMRNVCQEKIVPIFEEISQEYDGKVVQREAFLNLEHDFYRTTRVELSHLIDTSCLKPLFSAVEKTLEDILVTMHGENFADPDFEAILGSISNVGSGGDGVGRKSPRDDDIHQRSPTSVDKLPLVLLPPSPYMKEFLEFVKGFKRNVLNPLYGHNFDFNQSPTSHSNKGLEGQGMETRSGSVLNQFKEQVLSHTVQNFVLNLSTVRPVNDAGRQKLASDAAHFETALTSILLPGHDIESYDFPTVEPSSESSLCSTFRYFTQSYVLGNRLEPYPNVNVTDMTNVGGLRPIHIAALLYAFTYFDDDREVRNLLPSPHQKLFLKKDEFWRVWLKPKFTSGDDGRLEILALIKSCFDEYASEIFKSQRDTFHPTYPIVMKMFEEIDCDIKSS